MIDPETGRRTLGLIAAAIIIGSPAIRYYAGQARRRRRALRVADSMGGIIPPLNVHLVPDPSPEPWALRRAAEFEALGFHSVGGFRIEGAKTRGVVLLGDEGRTIVEVMNSPMSGRETGVIRQSIEGDVVRVGDKAWLDGPPWMRVVHLPRATAMALLQSLRMQSIPGEPLRLTPETYAAHAERDTRRISEWTLVHGPLRAEMIPYLEELTGRTAEPEAAELLRRAHDASDSYPRG